MKQQQSSKVRRLALGAAVVAALAGGGWWYTHKDAAAPTERPGRSGENRPVSVTTAKAERRDVPIYLDALGTVQAYQTVTVRTRVDGELVDVLFKEGQDVKAGDVLAQIDARTLRAQLDQALATRDKDIAQLENARQDLKRYEMLGNRVTAQSVDTQRAQVKQLEATVRADQAQADNYRVQLGYTVITAPIEGRTGMRQVDPGNIVKSTDANGLVVLTQLQPISVLFTLPQQHLTAVNEHQAADGGLKVLAVQADGKTVVDEGRLELVDNQIDTSTGTVKLKAVMPNPERKLWPGGFVNVRLLVTTRQNGLVVPAAAVQRGPQGPYVFVVKDDRTVEMRTLAIGTVERDVALVESGLDGGETIVVDGANKLQNGARIRTGGEDGESGPGEGGERRRGKGPRQ